MNYRRVLYLNLICALAVTCAWAGSNWRQHVSEADRTRVNPYAGQTQAAAAGSRLYAEHCASCHGNEALGTETKPSLRTTSVSDLTDGELWWLLKNGERRRGMPAWNSLPEPSRWQIITFVKTLGKSGSARPSNREQESK